MKQLFLGTGEETARVVNFERGIKGDERQIDPRFVPGSIFQTMAQGRRAQGDSSS